MQRENWEFETHTHRILSVGIVRASDDSCNNANVRRHVTVPNPGVSERSGNSRRTRTSGFLNADEMGNAPPQRLSYS